MQAIILAAGMGKRLKELTQNNTKCMITVNGKTLIDRMLHQLDHHNLKKIIIVIGYMGDVLKEHISTLDILTPIEFIENPIYETTNNIHSLALAKEQLCEDDTLLLESDLIFDDDVLDYILYDEYPTLVLVDKYKPWMDGTCLKINSNDSITEFIPKSKFEFKDSNKYYKTVNIYKFDKKFSKNVYVPFLDAYVKAVGNNEYYEQVLRIVSILDETVLKAKKLCGQNWYEIDDAQDLDIASSIFANVKEEKLSKIASRYGGYWRYPGMLDYCYLVNPYYPPKKMVDELTANFEKLLTQYPSGMNVNTLLVSKMFGIRERNIIVGNGAAELIKMLMEMLDGSFGFIAPTFQEYPNRAKDVETFTFTPNRDFEYSSEDLIEYFSKHHVNNLVLVNPENPTGNYIDKKGILLLIDWCKDSGIRLILDESFIDFADEEGATMLNQPIIGSNPHLYVIKSISKSYGVPGLRLGILASGDMDTISRMKESVSIWNINSFAEYYLQIEGKYTKDYLKALTMFKMERERFLRKLECIAGLSVYPSQANYFMVRITNGTTSRDITARLLSEHNILIKDLHEKTGDNLIRIAIRDQRDNDRLISALTDIMTVRE